MDSTDNTEEQSNAKRTAVVSPEQRRSGSQQEETRVSEDGTTTDIAPQEETENIDETPGAPAPLWLAKAAHGWSL